MKIAVLTGGGDCPGLNAVIRAVVRKAHLHGHQTVGVLDGWAGLLEGRFRSLEVSDVRGILPRGGTILGTSGMPGSTVAEQLHTVRSNLAAAGADAAVAEDGFLVVGVPKTIDNDLSGTDVTFGFDTAVNIATDAIDRLHTTAESHHRILVVEVMGRNAGWIALHSGIAGGANAILIPEIPFSLKQVEGWIASRFRSWWPNGPYLKTLRCSNASERPTPSVRATSPVSVPGWQRRSRSARGTRRAPRCWVMCSAVALQRHSTARWRPDWG
jgi:6-phosphofructokinase